MNFVSKLIFLFLISISINSYANSKSFVLGKGVNLVNFDSRYIKLVGNEIFLNEYKTGQETQIEFTADFTGKNCLIGEKRVCGAKTSVSLGPLDLSKRTLTITYHDKDKMRAFKINRLPKELPPIEIKGSSDLKKDFVFSWIPQKVNPHDTIENSYLFIFSPKGNLKFFRKLPYVAIDFKPHVLGDKLFYTYLKSSAFYPFVTLEGKRILFDQNMSFVKEFPELLDLHDFKLLGKDWYMAISYGISKNSLGKKFIQQSIIEVKNGKKIYEWSLDDFTKWNPFPNWKLNSFFREQYAIHQFHLNHFQILGNSLLISLGFESVIMINKEKKTVDWVLGGGSDQFGAIGDLGTSLHHTPNLDLKTSTLTLFDNGIDKKSSRVLEYKLDLKNKKIKKFSIIHTPSVYAVMMGSVNREGEIYTVGFGTRDVGKVDIAEIQNNKMNMSFYFNYPTSGIYQVYRIDSNF